MKNISSIACTVLKHPVHLNYQSAAMKRRGKLKIMAKQTEVYTATQFMTEFYAPIFAGMSSESAEEREEEAADLVANYPEEVAKTMKEVADRINASTVGRKAVASYDKKSFTIQYS